MEYFDIDSQLKNELIYIEKIASNKECIVGGEDADLSIMRTNKIAKRTTLEASNSCQPMGYMSICKRPMGHQNRQFFRGRLHLKEPWCQLQWLQREHWKFKKQMDRNRRKERNIRWNFQLVRREHWTVETGESLNFIENSFTRNESQVFKRAMFCKEKRQLKGGIHIIGVRGKTLMV